MSALAAICRALSDERRLRLFKRIAAAGRDGVDGVEIGDAEGLAILIDAGLVAALPLARGAHYRAEGAVLVQAFDQLSSPAERSH